jgi:hypothetical protein
MALFAALVVSCLFSPSGWTQQALEGSKHRAPEGSVVEKVPDDYRTSLAANPAVPTRLIMAVR